MSDVLVVEMWPHEPYECGMCPAMGLWTHCVPYYCGPVADGCNEGMYRAVCPACYRRWERWNDSLKYYGA